MQSSAFLNLIMNNPMVKGNQPFQNAIRMYQNHDTQGLKDLAENISKSKGINLADFEKDARNRFS